MSSNGHLGKGTGRPKWHHEEWPDGSLARLSDLLGSAISMLFLLLVGALLVKALLGLAASLGRALGCRPGCCGCGESLPGMNQGTGATNDPPQVDPPSGLGK